MKTQIKRVGAASTLNFSSALFDASTNMRTHLLVPYFVIGTYLDSLKTAPNELLAAGL